MSSNSPAFGQFCRKFRNARREKNSWNDGRPDQSSQTKPKHCPECIHYCILKCLKLLNKMALSKKNCKTIYESGFAEAAINLLEECELSNECQLQLFGLMDNIANYCPESIDLIGERCGIQLLGRMAKNKKDIKLLQLGMVFLSVGTCRKITWLCPECWFSCCLKWISTDWRNSLW